MQRYDAVVIGGGHNGLAAALHLLTQGWRVAIVEAKDRFGGAVKTGELTAPGFRHDVAAMNLSMFAGSPFLARHREILTANGLAFVAAPRCFATVFPDDTFLGVDADPDSTVGGIERLCARDAQAWTDMLHIFKRDAPFIFALLNNRMPSIKTARIIFGAVRRHGLSWLDDLMRLLVASPRDFLDAHFEHHKVKTMMAAWGLHLDFSPEIAGGALFPYLESMASQAFGMVIGQGGADTIIMAMVGAIREKGGMLISGSPVVNIEIDNGRATGVVLADGRMLHASRAVVANVHPKILAERLLPRHPKFAGFVRRMSRLRAGPGTMMIHLAMHDLPDWKAGAHVREYAYVHVAPNLAMMSRVYAEAGDGMLPELPVLVVGQPTTIDPSRAPAGKHVLWIQVRTLPAQIKGDAAGIISTRDWDQAKEQYADRVLDILEQYAPGTRAKIIQRCVFSPVDLERENANLIGGDSLSGSHHLDQSFFLRPAAGYSRYATPAKGLYMCGASTWPGAGTGAASGFMLAQHLAAVR
ncbi:phytoene desaturase family protein [Paraburkholderia solisilvae]|uniref:Pyridine nucleotide-disulfide oxidoreductase domain-containing protein 2 n=1 Tax=Paraburkholderia solisilvae TaxID=624376 RepID=A0A6J5EFM8_9BURK|nr:NAD(P)/FAD-dependent oxidoreductase [Paraburkholderia solisilvae]CAB3765259.1 Phytoene desaturase (neurosporene-forming) [Paraburkholderia solisilvae]